MTEEQDLLLYSITDEYWKEFSQLVGKHLSRVPKSLRADLLIRIEEHSSAHGSDFERYLKK